MKMRVSQPYSKLQANVQSALQDEVVAKMFIDAWLDELGLPSQHSFSNLPLPIGCGHYVSAKMVRKWTNLHSACLYNKLTRYSETFLDYGLLVAYDDDKSDRVKAADALGLHSYLNMTSSLYLFSPRCVILFLLTSRNERCANFRKFIRDYAPEQAYSMRKLIATTSTTLVTNHV